MDSHAGNRILHRRCRLYQGASIRTLEPLASASDYNELIFPAFAEFIGDRALEIDCCGRLSRGFACLTGYRQSLLAKNLENKDLILHA